MKVLLALGGNAMTNAEGRARPEDQIAAAEVAMAAVGALLETGADVVVTHGNGPQVGNLLVKNEVAAAVVPPVPLDWCGAQTQATLGFVLMDALDAEVARRGLERRSAALVTRTLVDLDDPGFTKPTKPIGRFLPAEEAALLVEHGETWEDRGEKGWRRMVASPEPLEILDAPAVQALMESGFVVIANGGGGIPVVREADGSLRGVEAVIDKDLGAALLGKMVGADVLVIATDVAHAVLRYGTPEAEDIGRVRCRRWRRTPLRGTSRAAPWVPRSWPRAASCGPPAGPLPSPTWTASSTRSRAAPAPSYCPTPLHRKEPHAQSAIEVRKVPIHSVADASELTKLLDDGVMDASRVIAIIGKTEGNGGVNDYTRIIADRAFREALVAGGAPAEQVKEVPIVWSGGTDGVISPHATIFATTDAEPSDEPRLTVGFAMSEQLLPEDIGRVPMIEKVADAVKVAMERAGITDPAEVHYVQTKTPLLTIHTIRDAKSRGKTVWTEETHQSMDLSNGCTALGIAVALGEIKMPGDDDVMHNRSLFSSVASCSSGVELDQAQVVVVGNAPGVGGRYRIGHSVMKDALDQDGIWDAIRSAGLDLPERPRTADLDGKLVNVFLKCEASQDGEVRGRRNAMLDDSDVHWHRQIKACVGGVTAAVTGDPAVFVSVSAAHQGPDGGGPVAAIVDLG